MFRDKARYGQNPEEVVRSKPPTFNKPLRWQREAEAAGRIDRVFVASWADFFSKEADEWRGEAWAIIRQCPNLIFQVLTKRHGRIQGCLPSDWGTGYANVWLGVSAENAEWWDRRVSVLREIPATVRFVSYEPALGSIRGCSAEGIDWVIIGGESGNGRGDETTRPFDIGWALEAIEICRRDGAAPFVKQLGTKPIRIVPAVPSNGTFQVELADNHGGEWDEWPDAALRVREYPRPRLVGPRGTVVNVAKEDIAFTTFALYRNPLDYPGKFVLRRWVVIRGRPDPVADPVAACVADTADECIRALPSDRAWQKLIPPKVPTNGIEPDPSIVMEWI
jgi:protein gp37